MKALAEELVVLDKEGCPSGRKVGTGSNSGKVMAGSVSQLVVMQYSLNP